LARNFSGVGYWAGLAAMASAVAYDVVQILQVAGILRFPVDEILALYYLTPPGRQFWTHASLIFTIIYAVFVTANYVVQLATVIPAKVRGGPKPFEFWNRPRIPCSGTLTPWATSRWASPACSPFLRSITPALSAGSGGRSSPMLS
jgi:hypothetical protein